MFDQPSQPPPLIDLTSRVMLVSVNISVWSGKKVDPNVTSLIEQHHQLEPRQSGEFTKRFICKPALQSIHHLSGQARKEHYARTSPWNDLGDRVLSARAYMKYMETMAKIQEQFQNEISKFIQAYPAIINEARHRLKDTFDIDDYPDVSGVRQKFEFGVSVSPFPSSRNWAVDALGSEMDELRNKHDQRVQEGVDDAVKHAYRLVAKVTGEMVKKLSEYNRDPETSKVTGGRFQDSLVENIRELVSALPDLNFTDDPLLTDITARLAEVTRFDGSQLRVAAPMREITKAKAQEVYDMVAGLL